MSTTAKDKGITENAYIVAFNGDFLDQLVDAQALLEVASKLIIHHEDMEMNERALLGLSLVVDQIKELLDINANLLPDNAIVEYTRARSLMAD